MHRRGFLQASLSTGLFFGGAASFTPVQAQETIVGKENSGKLLRPLGLQLSTVTPLLVNDFEGTLARVAEVGYRQVEFSALGLLGRPVAKVTELLDAHQLEAPVGRVSPPLPDNFATLNRLEQRQVFMARGGLEHFLDNVRYSLDIALQMGQKQLVLPALFPDRFQNLDQVKENIDLLNQAGTICAEQGVLFGYHNHDWELKALEGKIPYHMMIEQTDASALSFQLDAYWVTKGGGELKDYLTTFAGRFTSAHLKDINAQGSFEDVGFGLINFPAFIRHAKQVGCDYFFVERDNPPDPFNAIVRSYGYLETMRF
ncbi:MAG: TIM barrel protein [Pseudomonadota bacterium]